MSSPKVLSQLIGQLFLVWTKLPSNRRKVQINNFLKLKNIKEVKPNQQEAKMWKIGEDWDKLRTRFLDLKMQCRKRCYFLLSYNNFHIYIKQLQRGVVVTNQRPLPMVRSVFQETQENSGHCFPRKTRHEPMGDKIPPHIQHGQDPLCVLQTAGSH